MAGEGHRVEPGDNAVFDLQELLRRPRYSILPLADAWKRLTTGDNLFCALLKELDGGDLTEAVQWVHEWRREFEFIQGDKHSQWEIVRAMVVCARVASLRHTEATEAAALPELLHELDPNAVPNAWGSLGKSTGDADTWRSFRLECVANLRCTDPITTEWALGCVRSFLGRQRNNKRDQPVRSIEVCVVGVDPETRKGCLHTLVLELLERGSEKMQISHHPADVFATKTDKELQQSLSDAWFMACEGKNCAFDVRWRLYQGWTENANDRPLLAFLDTASQRSASGQAVRGLWHLLHDKIPDHRVIFLAQVDPSNHLRLNRVDGVPDKVTAILRNGSFDTIVVADPSRGKTNNQMQAEVVLRGASDGSKVRVINLGNDASLREVTAVRSQRVEVVLDFLDRLPRLGLGANVPFRPEQLSNDKLREFCLPVQVIDEKQYQDLANEEENRLRVSHPDDLTTAETLQRMGAQERVESKPFEEVLRKASSPHRILRGEPGEGKTTALWLHVAQRCADLARQLRDQQIDPVDPAFRIPLILPLRDVPEKTAKLRLLNLARDYVLRLCYGTPEAAPPTLRAWLSSKADRGQVELNLDALDELPSAPKHNSREWLRAELAHCTGLPILLTTRARADDQSLLASPQRYRLVGFTPGEVDEFCKRWFSHVPNGEKLLAELRGRLRLSPGPRHMVRLPLLLALLCLRKERYPGEPLPTTRAELLGLSVNALFERGDEKFRKINKNKARTGRNGIKQRILQAVAEQFYGEEGPIPLKKADLLETLVSELSKERPRLKKSGEEQALPGNADALLDEYLEDGVLVPVGSDSYRFILRSFHECLAASAYAEQANPPGGSCCCNRRRWEGAPSYAEQANPPGGSWRAVASVVREKALLDQWHNVIALLGEMLTDKEPLRKLLAGEEDDSGKIKVVGLIADPGIKLRVRASLGNILAEIGDSRPGVAPRSVEQLGQMQFCYVPRGPFWMGDGKGDDCPERLNKSLKYAYWIARYPVTVAQFKLFVEARGYETEEFWKEAIAAGYWMEGKGFKGKFEDEWRKEPATYGAPFDLPNHPVVGVSCYEALAYCRWLNQIARQWLQKGGEVRLQSEAEFEKAARGGLKILDPPLIKPMASRLVAPSAPELEDNGRPKRLYPWGDKDETDQFDPEKANGWESEVRATSAVGCCANGASPYGMVDAVGNVWCWTSSQYQKYPYDPNDGREDLGSEGRVLRGGSWYVNAWNCRASGRYLYDPSYRHDYFGLRVVVVAR